MDKAYMENCWNYFIYLDFEEFVGHRNGMSNSLWKMSQGLMELYWFRKYTYIFETIQIRILPRKGIQNEKRKELKAELGEYWLLKVEQDLAKETKEGQYERH